MKKAIEKHREISRKYKEIQERTSEKLQPNLLYVLSRFDTDDIEFHDNHIRLAFKDFVIHLSHKKHATTYNLTYVHDKYSNKSKTLGSPIAFNNYGEFNTIQKAIASGNAFVLDGLVTGKMLSNSCTLDGETNPSNKDWFNIALPILEKEGLTPDKVTTSRSGEFEEAKFGNLILKANRSYFKTEFVCYETQKTNVVFTLPITEEYFNDEPTVIKSLVDNMKLAVKFSTGFLNKEEDILKAFAYHNDLSYKKRFSNIIDSFGELNLSKLVFELRPKSKCGYYLEVGFENNEFVLTFYSNFVSHSYDANKEIVLKASDFSEVVEKITEITKEFEVE